MSSINQTPESSGLVRESITPKTLVSVVSLTTDYGSLFYKFFLSCLLVLISAFVFSLVPVFVGSDLGVVASILKGIYSLLTVGFPTMILVGSVVLVCSILFNGAAASIIVPKAIAHSLEIMSAHKAIDYVELKVMAFYDHISSKSSALAVKSNLSKLDVACAKFILNAVGIDPANLIALASKEDFSSLIRGKIENSIDDFKKPDYTKFVIILVSPWIALLVSIILFG